MKNLTSKIKLGLASLLVTPVFFSAAIAQNTLSLTPAYFDTTSSGAFVSGADQQYGFGGFTFITVGSQNLLVTELGAYVGESRFRDSMTTAGGTLTSEPFTSIIYDAATTKRVDYTVIGTGSAVNSDYMTYATITPITLLAGHQYALGSFAGVANAPGADFTPSSPDYIYDGVFARTYPGNPNHTLALETAPGLTITGAGGEYTGGSINSYPGKDGGLSNSLGGNIVYTVIPEPSDLAYMVIGGVVLFFGLRGKMAKNS